MSDTTTNVQGRVGMETAADGQYQPVRLGRNGEQVMSAIHGDFYEAVARGNVFHLPCGPTTTGIAVGNLTGASAAAVVQLALWNPLGSGINISLLAFHLGLVSGTPAAGAVVHGYLAAQLGDTLPTIASTTATLPRNCLISGSNTSKASFVSTVASSGTALTGATAVRVLAPTDFSATATAEAAASYSKSVERIDGRIVLAPGSLWLPLFPGAGTSVLSFMGITYEEIPA